MELLNHARESYVCSIFRDLLGLPDRAVALTTKHFDVVEVESSFVLKVRCTRKRTAAGKGLVY